MTNEVLAGAIIPSLVFKGGFFISAKFDKNLSLMEAQNWMNRC